MKGKNQVEPIIKKMLQPQSVISAAFKEAGPGPLDTLRRRLWIRSDRQQPGRGVEWQPRKINGWNLRIITPLEEENHLNQTHRFLGSMLIFGGAI